MASEQLIDDRFEMAERIGAGGMGEVYRALDRQTGSVVALKLLLSSAGSGDSTRFLREAQVLAGLRVPGVVRYIAHGVTSEGRPYLAMEWLAGETLHQSIARRELTIAESIALGLRVATTTRGRWSSRVRSIRHAVPPSQGVTKSPLEPKLEMTYPSIMGHLHILCSEEIDA